MISRSIVVLVAGTVLSAACGRGPGGGGAATGDGEPVANDVPSSAPAESPPGPDSVRILRDLAVLAHDSMEGRATGTPGGDRARSFVSRALAEAGAQPIGGPSLEHPFTWGEDGAGGVNVIGIIPGSGETIIVLSAHFDHVGIRDGEIYNGADDNASGTAAVLEIARLAARSTLESTLVIALFDAEERGLQGARAFVADPPLPLPQGTLNVNLDMVSRSDGVLWAAGAFHTPALRPILEAVAPGAPVDLRLGHDRPNAPEGDDWTGSSDHGPFHDAGFPFVYFGVEDHPDYHRPSDDVERVDPGELVASVRTIYEALLALDAALPLVESGPRE